MFRKLQYLFLIVSVFLLAVMPAAAQSTLNVDTGVFIDNINAWLGTAMPIAAIGVGIAGAFALANYVGGMIVKAFKGG
jgi:hypothetical protein